mgnify:FL=1
MFKNIFSKESLAVLKDRKLMIAIGAVIFVPLMYAGMFLWAFWDPYDRLDDIPVAIVNEDVPYRFEGETYKLGEELVDRLKEEDEFDFHFVDRQAGYKGLQDQDYYILIEIPSDFSRNATTLMDDDPEKLRLRYVPNESYNFLASQIGETAMLHIEMALEEKIIESYTETMFDKVDEVADGLEEAEEATEKLDDGAEKLQENTHLLKDHLATLAEKSIEFVDGSEALKDGAGELASGTQELNQGVGKLYDASGQLLDGAKKVKDGQNELAQGMKQADAGVKEMKDNVPALINGTDQFKAGLSEFEEQLPKQMAKQIETALTKGEKELESGIEQLEKGIVSGLGASSNNPEGLAYQLSKGIVKEIHQQLDQVGKQAENLPAQLSKELSEALAKSIVKQNEETMKELSQALLKAGIPEEQVQKIIQGIVEQSPTEAQVQQKLEHEINQGIQAKMPNMDEALTDKKAEIAQAIEKGVYGAIGQTEKKIEAGFDQFSKEVSNSLKGAGGNIETSIAQGTSPVFKQLQGGLGSIQEGQKALQDGIGQLANGTKELSSGANQLVAGQGEYVSQMTLYTEKFLEAKEGVNALEDGSFQLLDGVTQLEDGAKKFQEGTDKLAEGSKKLAEGTDELKDGTEEFNEEMSKAVDEINDVEADEDTYNMMANPVKVDNEKINEVPNYGTGFAPYFLSLGLYVGALLLSIVYPLREPSVVPTSGFNWFLRKTIGLAIIGILQALIAASVLLFGLKIEVQSVTLFYLFSIFTSWTFIALIQFLVTCFDDPGRFMAIIVLILQLTTSAGTFPLELIPEVLQAFNAFLPMTYSVAGLKAVISSGEFGVMWMNTGILALFTIACLLLSLSYFVVMFKRKFATMQDKA